MTKLPSILTIFVAVGAEAAQPKMELLDDLTREERCFLKVLCETKDRIKYGRDNWTPEQCTEIGHQFIRSARRHDFTPAFLAAFAIHESDLRENITRTSTIETINGSSVFAHDGGLLGVRCTHEPFPALSPKKWKDITCRNGSIRKMTLAQLMDPIDRVLPDGDVLPGNIEIGARILADLRKGVPILTTGKVMLNGHFKAVRKVIPCRHTKHSWLYHYNWGNKQQGKSKFYGHSVANLYTALAVATGQTDLPELKDSVLYVDKKGRSVPAHKPLTPRHRELYAKIIACKGTCSRVAFTKILTP